jgi:hypothetical protein
VKAAVPESAETTPANPIPVKPPAADQKRPPPAKAAKQQPAPPAKAAEQAPAPPAETTSPEIAPPQPADAAPIEEQKPAPAAEAAPPEAEAEPANAAPPPEAEPASAESGISDDPNLTTVLIDTSEPDSLSGGLVEADDSGKEKAAIEDDFVDVASASSGHSGTVKEEKTNAASEEVLVEVMNSDPDVF